MYYVKFHSETKRSEIINSSYIEGSFEVSDELVFNNPYLILEDDDSIRGPSEEELEAEKIKLENAELIKQARQIRDMKLASSDIYVLPDRLEMLTDDKKAELFAYRQSLRDITLQENFPNEIIWPEFSL